MVILMASLGHRRERPAPGALAAPCRGDEPHPVHALDGPDDVSAAKQGPPARACLVHEGEALEPDLLLERRHVTAEHAAIQLEAQYPQPVAQPEEPDEA